MKEQGYRREKAVLTNLAHNTNFW